MTVPATCTVAAAAAFLRAANHLRDALSALRSVGKTEDNGEFGFAVRDLERIHSVCVQLARPQTVPAQEPAKVDSKPVAVPVATPKTDSLPRCLGCKATCNPAFLTGGYCRKASCQAKAKPAPKAAAQTVAAPKAVAPKAETKPAATKPAPKATPKTSGLDAYRKLQAECKVLGLSAKGTKDELTARIAAAKAKLAAQTTETPAAVAPKTVTLTVPADKANMLRKLAELPADMLSQLLALAN